MESVRNDFALELDSDGLVGVQSARGPVAPPTAAFNSLRHWGSELRYCRTLLNSHWPCDTVMVLVVVISTFGFK